MMIEKPFQQPSVMAAQRSFAQVPAADTERSTFDRSHAHKTTFDAGKLIPIFLDEVLPGDTHTLNSRVFARLATPLKPFMDNVYLDVHYFFVPMRLLWEHWQEFCGERKSPDDDPSTYTIPTILWDPYNDPGGPGSGYGGGTTVGQQFGLSPVQELTGNGVEVSVLPFRGLS